MTKSTGKSSSAIDAAETKATTTKRVVSMAAEKAPAKTAVKVAKPAAKTAAKKTAKAAAADKPEKVTKARAKKAEDKLADLVGSARPAPSGRRPGRPAKNANNDSDGFDDTMDGDGEVLPDLKPPKRGGKRGKADPKDLIARGPVTPEEYEARRNRLKQLIKLGKDRGYLTYG
jgi:RNA polymerase primary sigma factor